jgi:hypothetical protein
VVSFRRFARGAAANEGRGLAAESLFVTLPLLMVMARSAEMLMRSKYVSTVKFVYSLIFALNVLKISLLSAILGMLRNSTCGVSS